MVRNAFDISSSRPFMASIFRISIGDVHRRRTEIVRHLIDLGAERRQRRNQLGLLIVQPGVDLLLDAGEPRVHVPRSVHRLLEHLLKRRHLFILRALKLLDLVLQIRKVALDGDDVLFLLGHQRRGSKYQPQNEQTLHMDRSPLELRPGLQRAEPGVKCARRLR